MQKENMPPINLAEENAVAKTDTPVVRMRTMVNALHTLHAIDVGVQMGFFRIIAQSAQPGSIDTFVKQTKFSEQYVIPWLRAMQSTGVIDINNNNITIRPDWREVLTNEKSSDYMANLPACHLAIVDGYRRVPEAFRNGTIFSPNEFSKEMVRAISSDSIRFTNLFIGKVLDALPELKEKLTNGATVYDVGCGGGLMSINLAEYFSRSTFIGIDVLPQAIEVAREEAIRLQAGNNLSFRVMNATQLPTGKADCVILNEVWHEIQPSQRLSALKAIRGALKQDGVLFVVEALVPEDPNEYVKSEYRPAALCDFVEAPWGSKMPTRSEFNALLTEAGFGEPKYIQSSDVVFAAVVSP